jgi:hypothetical protein
MAAVAFAVPGTAAAQELLCPQNGLPVSQDPSCMSRWNEQQASERADIDAPRSLPPGMDPRNLPPPDPSVEGLWGSLVAAPDHRLYWSQGRRDRKSAEEMALGNCQSNQAANAQDGCQVLNTGEAIDVALAFDGTTYFVGRTPGHEKAIVKALKACRAGPSPDQCRIGLLYSPVSGVVPEDVAKVVFGL